MTYDILIIGGGINGCAIAREAALNCLDVLLVEKDDLAAHTSSASTKLIHGGLRYLEYYDFGLVSEALRERERLIKAAPHIIRPMRFVLPHENAVRPWWLVRLGLYLYDFLGGRMTLPKSRGLGKNDTVYTAPLKGGSKGFVYSDAFVDDARLTVLNAVNAASKGAVIEVGIALDRARRDGGIWRALLSDGRTVESRAIVNAAGPWVHQMLDPLGVIAKSDVRLVKGSHIVVPRLYDGDHAYMLQQPDRRIVFAIPYQGGTEIGTTDVPVDTPEDVKISDEEIAYLCAAANAHFVRQIAPGDVISSWSGVRPLYDDGASEAKEVTRDYVLELDTDGPPLLSVFGGKITTARHLAEEAVAKLGPALNFDAQHVTRDRAFPGGDTHGGWLALLAETRQRWPFLEAAQAERLTHAYGSLLGDMLHNVSGAADMGQDFGHGFTEIEARWMHDREWARTPDDALMRRSKLGLHLDTEQRAAFARWWGSHYA